MNLARRAGAFVAPLLAALTLAPLMLPLPVSAGTRGSGRAASEQRQTADFQAIALSGSMDLSVRQGTPQSVQVLADDNLLPLLETVVEPGSHGPTLQVRWKGNQDPSPRSRVSVTVVVPRLTALTAAGAGDLRVQNFSTPALKVSLIGAGDLQLDGLETDELVVNLSGSGDVGGRGKATRLKVSIAGSGDVRLADLRAQDVAVSIAGSGDATVNAQKSLDVHIAGSGDVSYSGNAALKSSIAGSGSVNRR